MGGWKLTSFILVLIEPNIFHPKCYIDLILSRTAPSESICNPTLKELQQPVFPQLGTPRTHHGKKIRRELKPDYE